jgi:hypothetical protein
VSGALPPGCAPGSAAGIRVVKFTDHVATQGKYGFQLQVKNATLPVVADAPLLGSVALSEDDGSNTGRCGTLNFAPRSFRGTTARFSP